MRLGVFAEAGLQQHTVANKALYNGYDVTLLENGQTDSVSRHRIHHVQGRLSDRQSVDQIIGQSDAVVGILHGRLHHFDETSKWLLQQLIDAMYSHRVKRLVLYSPAAAADILRSTGLDWTVIEQPQQGGELIHTDMAHTMINQVTEVSHLRDIFRCHPVAS